MWHMGISTARLNRLVPILFNQICLKGKVTERRENGVGGLPIPGSLPQSPGIVAEARILGVRLGLAWRWQWPGAWAVLCCLPGTLAGELDQSGAVRTRTDTPTQDASISSSCLYDCVVTELPTSFLIF